MISSWIIFQDNSHNNNLNKKKWVFITIFINNKYKKKLSIFYKKMIY